MQKLLILVLSVMAIMVNAAVIYPGGGGTSTGGTNIYTLAATNIVDSSDITVGNVYTNNTTSNLWLNVSVKYQSGGNQGVNLQIDQDNNGVFETARTARTVAASVNDEVPISGFILPGGVYKLVTLSGSVAEINTTCQRVYSGLGAVTITNGGGSGGLAQQQVTDMFKAGTNQLTGSGFSVSNLNASEVIVVTNAFADGLRDDWGAVSNAIYRVNNGNYRQLVFPPGTYLISTNLPDINGVHGLSIFGNGNAYLVTTNIGLNGLFLLRNHNVEVHHLWFGGPGVSYNSTQSKSTAIRTASNASGGFIGGINLHDLFITNFDKGIQLSNTVGAVVNNCFVYASGWYGIRVDTCDNTRITGNFIGNSYTNVNTEFGASHSYAGNVFSQTNAWGIYCVNGANQAGVILEMNNVGQTGKGVYNNGGEAWWKDNVVETLYGVDRNGGMMEATNSAIVADGNGFTAAIQGTIPAPTAQNGGYIVLNNCALDQSYVMSLNGANANGSTNSIGVFGTTGTSIYPHWDGMAANVVVHATFGDAGTVYTTPTIYYQNVFKQNTTVARVNMVPASTWYSVTDASLAARDTAGHTLLFRDGAQIAATGLGAGIQSLNDSTSDVLTFGALSYRFISTSGDLTLYGTGAFTGNGGGLSNVTASAVVGTATGSTLQLYDTNAVLYFSSYGTNVPPTTVINGNVSMTNLNLRSLDTPINGNTIDSTLNAKVYETNATMTIAGFANLVASGQALFSVTYSNRSASPIIINGPPSSNYIGSSSTNAMTLASGKMGVWSFWVLLNKFTNICNAASQ